MDPSMRFLMNKPNVIYEVFEDEVVIINLGSGSYYSVDKVGAEVWRFIVNGAAVDEIVDSIREQYKNKGVVDIEKAINQFVEELKREELIVPYPATEPENISRSKLKVESLSTTITFDFEAPSLHKYTDMQELLLLDPIHEVDETGWPSTKPDSSKDNG